MDPRTEALLLLGSLLFGVATMAEAGRFETKNYAGFSVGPTTTCAYAPGTDPSLGGACFDLQSLDSTVQVTVEDADGGPIAGWAYFAYGTLDDPENFLGLLPGFYICGHSLVQNVFSGAERLVVVLDAYQVPRTRVGLLDCPGADLPTQGTIRVDFGD